MRRRLLRWIFVVFCGAVAAVLGVATALLYSPPGRQLLVRLVSGRAGDMIIFGGTNIYPAEIESELMKVPGVADCAVFGIPDEEFGEKVCAFIQPNSGVVLDEEEIRADLKSRLAGYKIPKRIEFADTLPREDTGKIFKRKLKEPFWQGVGRSI